MIKAVYIHIPFCKRICSYCDFTKMYYNKQFVNKYLNALEKEIDARYTGELVESIYIGGGTPSVLDISELQRLFKIVSKINTSKDLEFTFEINFESINKEKLLFLKKHKVNRLSFGIESIDYNNQIVMARESNKKDITDIIALAKQLGFNNINVDLMYAFPNEKLSVLKKDLDFILSLNIEHISTYSLIIAPHTKLYLDGYHNTEENIEIDMYKYICQTLKKNNYIHYEISNFAVKEKESNHNLTYWNNDEYYGFGLGAASYVKDVRLLNTKSINNYISSNYIYEQERITNDLKIEYEIMLNLRKREGINKEVFKSKYGIDIKSKYNLGLLIENGMLVESKDSIYIPEDKWYVSNEIIVNILRSKNG